MIIDADYPNIVLSFTYQNFVMQVDQSEWQGQTVYSVWANHAGGCAVAVPCADSRAEAIHRAKQWVDRRSIAHIL